MNNIKGMQQREREAWMDTSEQILNGLQLGNLGKKSAQGFSSLWQIAFIKVVFSKNHLDCDVTII